MVLVLLALTTWKLLAWREEQGLVNAANDATAAATNEVEGLIGISSTTSAEHIDSLLAGATADFRAELADQAERLRATLEKNNVKATGKVVSTGIVSITEDRASVILAATGTVRNKQATAPEPRNYRLRVDLSKKSDQWLVSGLEFVG